MRINFSISKIGSENSNVAMDLVLFNPNNFGLTLKNVNCDISVDSNFIGKFTLDTTIHISGKTEFNVPVKLNIDIRNVLQSSLSMLFREVKIGAVGTTKVGKGGFYKTIPINYQGMHKLNLFE